MINDIIVAATMPFKAVSVKSHTPLHTALQPSKHPLKSLRASLTVTVLSASLSAGSKLKVLLAALFSFTNSPMSARCLVCVRIRITVN